MSMSFQLQVSKELQDQICYSAKYSDDNFEYRHVVLPKEMVPKVPKHLLSEVEWRSLGVQQSRGWVHYAIHTPERHILLFRRMHNNEVSDKSQHQQIQKQAVPAK